MRGALPKGTHATALRSGSEELGLDDAPQLSSGGAGAGVAHMEGKEALGLTCMGSIGSHLPVAQSQPPAALLKLTFNVRRSGG